MQMQGGQPRGLKRLKDISPLVKSTWRRERTAFVNGERPDQDCHTLRVASYNIHKAVGTDGKFDPARIAAVIGEIDADVIALQEADQRFGEREGLLDLDILKRETGLQPVPMQMGKRGSHGWHGNVVLFRSGAITATRQLVLPGVEPRGALIVDFDLGAGPLRVVAAHLGLLRRSRAQQVRAILTAARSPESHPTVLMGDLNEWRLGERSALQGLAPQFGPLHAAIPSFPSRFPVWALDRILGFPSAVISHVELHETPLSRVASDHLPLKARLDLPVLARLAAE